MKISWVVTGGQALQHALASLPHRVSRRVQYEALFAGAASMRDRVESLAPVDPTSRLHLKENILVRRAVDPDGFGAAMVAIGPGRKTFWGGFQEWGTSHHKAQPFMRPAFDGLVRQTINIIKSYLAEFLLRRGALASTRTSGGGIGDSFGSSRPPISGGPGGGGFL